MEKQETIFRQKSVDRVSSPEQLDSYLKVTTPSVWLVLIGIIIILCGIIVWATFGKLKTYANVGCAVESKEAYCYIREEDGANVDVGMDVEIPNKNASFTIISIDRAGLKIPDSYNYLQHIIGVSSQDYVFSLVGKTDLADGYYSGRIATELISPLKFIFN